MRRHTRTVWAGGSKCCRTTFCINIVNITFRALCAQYAIFNTHIANRIIKESAGTIATTYRWITIKNTCPIDQRVTGSTNRWHISEHHRVWQAGAANLYLKRSGCRTPTCHWIIVIAGNITIYSTNCFVKSNIRSA